MVLCMKTASTVTSMIPVLVLAYYCALMATLLSEGLEHSEQGPPPG